LITSLIVTGLVRRVRAEQAERILTSDRLRNAQSQLTHVDRVATIGQLAASIAHEIKQPIAATVTNAQAALRWLDRRPPNLEEVRQSLHSIVKSGEHAGEVIDRIRAFIKKAPPRDCRQRLSVSSSPSIRPNRAAWGLGCLSATWLWESMAEVFGAGASLCRGPAF